MAEINRHDPSRRGRTRQPRPRAVDVAVTGSFMRPKRLLSGLGWNTIGQLLVVGISLGLTPFLLHHLGATQYGIFALASSVRGLLSNLDGGLGPTGSRYFPVYVGRGNVASTTSFLFTILTLVTIIVGAEAIIMIFFAPAVAAVFTIGPGLAGHSGEIVSLIRDLMPVLFIAAIRTQLQRLVMAHHRWAFINYTQIIAIVAYAVITVVGCYETPGLQCLVWGTYAQEGILFITVLWASSRYISWRDLRWLPTSEVSQILRFGRRIQIAAVASSINYEVDALLVGFFFPVRFVAYYSIGQNFSTQVINMPVNGLNPIAQEIGRRYGRKGKEGVLSSFSDTQKTWVTGLGIFPIIAALEGWFGIRIWLGPGSEVAAATGILLVLGSAPLLFNSIVDVTAKVLEMPEIESWYLGVGVVINVACTIPLALHIGVIGVSLGTAIGQVVSFVVCIYLARKMIGKEITPFFRSIRYVPALTASLIAVVLEWSLHTIIPNGAIGLVLSGLVSLPAFLTYYGWVYHRPLLEKFGIRFESRGRHGRTDARHARRQVAEENNDYTSRQLSGLLSLAALSEPEIMTVGPFTDSFVRLRDTSPLHYTGPLEQLYETSFKHSPQAGLAGRE